MKKFFFILPLIILAGCAEKMETFDPVAKFSEAEKHMKDGSYEKARNEYKEIQEKTPDKSYDPGIMLRIADTYFGEEKYEEALVEYQAFLNYHPANKDAPYAQYQLALCSYNQMSTIDRDPELTRNALKEFEALLRKYPRSAYEEEAGKYAAICRDRLAEYELYVARFYHKKGSYKAAIGRLEQLLRDFPGSSAEKDALYYAGLSYIETGERGKARKTLETLVKKYPSLERTAASLMKKLETE